MWTSEVIHLNVNVSYDNSYHMQIKVNKQASYMFQKQMFYEKVLTRFLKDTFCVK